MEVLSCFLHDVQVDLGATRETFKEDLGQLSVPVADFGLWEIDFPYEEGTSRKIKGARNSRLIHGKCGGAVASDALSIAQRFEKRFTKDDTEIFGRVMTVNLGVSFCFDLQIEQPVSRKLLQHVGEKGEWRLDRMLTRSIEIDLDADLSFRSLAFNACGT